MSIDTQHPLYKENLPRWKRCRDAFLGQDAIHSKATEYLPQPSGMDGGAYAAYVKRALYYEAIGRTIDGLVGCISRKGHQIIIPHSLEPMLDDVTGDGLSVNEFVKQAAAECILQGRGGVLVDWDNTLRRPCFSLYQAEQITNWSDDEVILRETVYERDADDPFKLVEIEQYRQLSIASGVYTVTLWRKQKANGGYGNEWVVYGEPITPQKRGVSLTYLPWVWLTPFGSTSRIAKPPLLGLVNVSISHYQSSADLAHGCHYTGLPTLVATGLADSDEPIRIGSAALITIRDPAARVYYAEFSGQGLQSLFAMLQSLENKMANTGASILAGAASKRPVTATEAEIRHSTETSLLHATVSATQVALKSALNIAADWAYAFGDVEVILNDDFVGRVMDGATLTGLVQAYQSGALELSTFLNALADGGLIPEIEAATNVA